MDTYFQRALLVLSSVLVLHGIASAQSDSSYEEIRKEFKSPDYARWGEVPLWWWEADSLSKERVTWELEKLADKGVKAVTPIQRSPARTYPESFSNDWWEMVKYVHNESKRLGMHLWLYDQVGYGNYGWLGKAAAQVDNTGTSRVKFISKEGISGKELQIKIPDGKLLSARAYPIIDGIPQDKNSKEISGYVENNTLEWAPEKGKWKVAVSVAEPYRSFYLNEQSTDIFIDQLYNRIEDIVGEDAMGKSLAGVFQDEHPPTPRNIYTKELANTFKKKFGYPIARAIPALHFDVGAKTPKYRIDYFDAYLSIVEKTYWEKIYNWTANRGVLTSHDNWGRKNIYRQTEGYINYFRTQRWFSAPGLDDFRQQPLEKRNYYDTKVASSIARLYDRPRVWAEAFHSSGWGRTTNQTLTWLSTLYAFGANLYDEHGLYYSLNAGTWEHAAGDTHFRQPYWNYYQEISDWVARTSYLMTRGSAVVDVAVHYPVVSLLAAPEGSKVDYNSYMGLSRMIYNDGMDNDIIDDQSIMNATVKNGRLHIGNNKYQALVFGPERTMRLPVLQKALQLAQNGGTVLFYGQLPSASVENGREDDKVKSLLEQLLGSVSNIKTDNILTKKSFKNDGYAAFRTNTAKLLPPLLSLHIERDVIANGGDIFYSHRSIGDLDIYLIQNTEDNPIDLNGRFRASGVPELWDPFTGKAEKIEGFKRNEKFTRARLSLEGNVAKLLIFKPGEKQEAEEPATEWGEKTISENWSFSVLPTRNNKWGDFRWPPTDKNIGPEVRQFKYKEEVNMSGTKLGWQNSGIDDSSWDKYLYSTGPYWLSLANIPKNSNVVRRILEKKEHLKTGSQINIESKNYKWKAITFSQKIGLGKPAPWGGHSGYPDGHYDKNFIQLSEGRKLLFTRIYSPKKQTAGLKVQLRNSESSLWVNGSEQPCEGAVCKLPLEEGYNTVLLDIPDGSGGKLYVQKKPPIISSKGDKGTTTYPQLDNASWIWYGDNDGAYFRKSFELKEMPKSAYIVVTGVTGFNLYINGKKIAEEIGPWANWEYPERLNIKKYLKEGKNTIAAWGQFFKSIHAFTSLTDSYKGLSLSMKAASNDGHTLTINTDNSWKGNAEETENWEASNFDDSGWSHAVSKGKVGSKPWGKAFLKNIGSSTTPYRPLSVALSSPDIQVFKRKPDIIYDIKPQQADRVGWYRFKAPPGLKKMKLNTDAEASVWVNGNEVSVSNGIAIIQESPVDVSDIAILLKMKRGKYAGAAFNLPIELVLGGGKIQTGPWKNFALPTYSGIGVYKQSVSFTQEEVKQRIKLDLGKVYVAAEVFVNGKSAGTRVAEPFKFDLTGLIEAGQNKIEIRVANTLAPHYSLPDRTLNLGPEKSGLIGPVSLKIGGE